MSLVLIKQDLLKSDATVIMHQANCFNKMGAGIAKQIARKYPRALIADNNCSLSPKERLGWFSHSVSIGEPTIVNLYGQYGYGSGVHTEYDKLESAISNFLLFAKNSEVINLDKIGVPYKMGCGLAGGDWNIVKEILEKMSNKHNVDIYIYQL